MDALQIQKLLSVSPHQPVCSPLLPAAAVPMLAWTVSWLVVCAVLCPCSSSKAVSGSPQVITQTVSYPNGQRGAHMLTCLPVSFKGVWCPTVTRMTQGTTSPCLLYAWVRTQLLHVPGAAGSENVVFTARWQHLSCHRGGPTPQPRLLNSLQTPS